MASSLVVSIVSNVVVVRISFGFGFSFSFGFAIETSVTPEVAVVHVVTVVVP